MSKDRLGASAARIVAAVRVGHHIRRNRAITPKTANKFGLIAVHCCHKHRVLVALGCSQFQALILVLKAANIILVHRIEYSPGVAVLIVDDITGAGLYDVAGIASLSSHVIPNALDSSLYAGCLGSKIVVHSVDSSSVIAAALLELSTEIAHSSVYTVEAVINGVSQSVGAVTDTVLDAVDSTLEIIKRESLVDIGTGSPALTGRGAKAVSTEAAVTAPAIAAEHTENQEKYNPGSPIAAPAAEAAVVAVCRHDLHSSVSSKRHCFVPFVVISHCGHSNDYLNIPLTDSNMPLIC